MDIQFEVQKIHSQFGTTEMANYQIQKLFDKLILEDRAEQLRKHAVVGRSEQLLAFVEFIDKDLIDNVKPSEIVERFLSQ
jgi:hypothetical protein